MTDDARAAGAMDKTIGTKMRRRRLEIGMSQETIADRLGVTFQQVQKYEKGVNRIAASRLWDIAGALGVDVRAFYPDDAARAALEGSSELERVLATPEGLRLVRAFLAAPVAIRRIIAELLHELAEEVGRLAPPRRG